MTDNNNIPSDNDRLKRVDDLILDNFDNNEQSIPPDTDKIKPDDSGDKISDATIDKIKFDMLPEELEKYIDKFVIKQNEAKEVLATKICTHFHRIKAKTLKMFPGSIKSNILMMGPTGVGKTYIIKLIADKIGVPFVKSDATKFSETGYVGRDVEDLVRELVHEANGDIELAEHGIIYVDEIDKIASSGNTYGPDVSRTGVQRNFLKIMEDTDVDIKSPSDIASQMEIALKFQKTGKIERKKINTKNILFIMSGAFNGLQEIIEKRLNKQSIGFCAPISAMTETCYTGEILRQTRADDFMNYGFESEFIGRLPVIVVLDSLEVDDLYKILRNPNCPVVLSKKYDFKAYGIDLRFTDESFQKIAEKTYLEKTGARALVSVIEKTLLKFEKKLPSTNIRHLVVTSEIVKNPGSEFKRILEDNNARVEQDELYHAFVENDKNRIKNRITDYLKNFQNIKFTQDTINFIIDKVLKEHTLTEKVCEEVIKMREEIDKFEKDFFEKFNIPVKFDDEAKDLILRKASEEKINVIQECQKILKDYELGLKLIQTRFGSTEFTITKEVVNDPDTYLNNLIKATYKEN